MRIIRKLIIDEISACDRPAQEDARMRIMKRDNTIEDSEMTQIEATNLIAKAAGALAEAALEGLARNLRKQHPELTPEQAFAKIYEDEANIELRRGERASAYAKLYPPVARTEPITEFGNLNSTGLDALMKLAEEFRRQNPMLTQEQAFAAVYADPANAELATAERAAAYERMLVPGVRVMA